MAVVAPADFKTAVDASKTRAVRAHPAVAVAGSRANLAFVALHQQWTERHSPELNRSDWPERLAEQCDR